MSGDVQVRFCEKLGVKILRLTRLASVQAGAHASAGLYSLITTAKANGIDPFDYLSLIFKELPAASTQEKLESLLPYNARKSYQLRSYGPKQ